MKSVEIYPSQIQSCCGFFCVRVQQGLGGGFLRLGAVGPPRGWVGRARSRQPAPSAVGCGTGSLRCQPTSQGWGSGVHGLLAHKRDRGVCKIWVFHLFQRHWYRTLFFGNLHACGVLQEMAMKSYSPGHECSSLKRQLYWNKSWQMRWYSNHLCWGCQECHWGHY